jgi:hypothetical protein
VYCGDVEMIVIIDFYERSVSAFFFFVSEGQMTPSPIVIDG